jgi:DNA-binding transcriptional LysR family regulator
MSRNLDLNLLRAFTTVADRQSLTAASKVLNLTQGAVSQQIARLEALTGGPLLLRDRRGVTLTASGERLLEKARRLIAFNDEMWSDINGGEITGLVRLGVPFDLVGTCVAPALKKFSESCPNVELTLVCDTSPALLRAVSANQLDLAIVEEPVGLASGESLAVDRLVWVGAKGGRAYSKAPIPISLVAETCCFRPAVLSALLAQKREWRIVFENGGLDATRATVRMDLAVSAWLASTVPSDLYILPPETGLPSLPAFAITLHWAGTAKGAAVSELAQRIRETVGRPSAQTA